MERDLVSDEELIVQTSSGSLDAFEEMEHVNRDLRNVGEFLLASLP